MVRFLHIHSIQLQNKGPKYDRLRPPAERRDESEKKDRRQNTNRKRYNDVVTTLTSESTVLMYAPIVRGIVYRRSPSPRCTLGHRQLSRGPNFLNTNA